METTPKRIRRKWFETTSATKSPQSRQAPNSPLQPAASWPIPPSTDQQHSQPAVRQRNVRHTATGVLSSIRNASCAVKQQQLLLGTRQLDGNGSQSSTYSKRGTHPFRPRDELKPQPPAAARSLINTKTRLKTKGPTSRSDASSSQEASCEQSCNSNPADGATKAAAAEPVTASALLEATPVQATASRPRAPPGSRPVGSRVERRAGQGSSSFASVSRPSRSATEQGSQGCTAHSTDRSSSSSSSSGRQATPANTPLKASTPSKTNTPSKSRSRPAFWHEGSAGVIGSSLSSQRQQLIAALRLLRQKQQGQQQRCNPTSSTLTDSAAGLAADCSGTVEQLRLAMDKSAAAAAAALEEVLLLDRALEVAQSFQHLQQAAAPAAGQPAAAEQVAHVDTFTALSSTLERLMVKQQKQLQARQQRASEHQQQLQEVVAQSNQPAEQLHHKMSANKLPITPTRSPCKAAQQQGGLNSSVATPTAAVGCCIDPFSWCGLANDNPLFISTAGSNSGSPPWTSPSKRHCSRSTAARSDVCAPTDSFWGTAPPEQTAPLAMRPPQPAQQQSYPAGNMLHELQQQTQQWFLSYVSDKLCQETKPVASRAECLDLLKALTRAQQWMQGHAQAECTELEQQTSSSSNLGSRFSSCSGAMTAAGVAEVSHIVTPKTPGSQLQNLQVAVRKQLCRYGYLRHQLPA